MRSVFGLIPWGQWFFFFHGVSGWSYSSGSDFGLIPWDQSLVLFHGVNPGLFHAVSIWSYSMGSVFGPHGIRPNTNLKEKHQPLTPWNKTKY
jgi:hypothetical protein